MNNRVLSDILKAKRTPSNVHVISRSGKWAVKKESNSRISGVFPTQGRAIAYAKKVASSGSNSLRVVVHRKDGTIA